MSDLFSYLLFSGLIFISAIATTVQGGLLSLNHYQLKRKAQAGDKQARAVYPLHVLRYELYLLTGALIFIANAWLIILLAQWTTDFVAVLLGSVILLLFSEVVPLLFLRKRALPIIAISSPLLRKLVGFCGPVTKPLARKIARVMQSQENAVYTKEQLVAMFENTLQKKDSDVSQDELLMLQGTLGFGEKMIRDIMTPRRMVRLVGQDDEVGPLLMDELHRSGHSRFPVTVDSKHMEFVGTLYLRDLVGQKTLRKVADIMSKDVRYIHEEESLDQALRAFLKTHHHLFVVVNNFEEFVGVLSIEDVLEEIIGKEIVDEFDAYDDLRAVAASIADKERAKRQKTVKTEKK